MNDWPLNCSTVGVVVRSGNGIADSPITMAVPSGANETRVPPNVIAEPPGISVCGPRMKMDPETAVKDRPLTCMTAGGVIVALMTDRLSTGIVDPPIINAFPSIASETGIPEIVTAAAPGVTVFVPMMRAELDPEVNLKPSAVNALCFEDIIRGWVDEPMTKAVAEGSRETGVPSMVIAAAPGVSVCEPTIYCEFEFLMASIPAILID